MPAFRPSLLLCVLGVHDWWIGPKPLIHGIYRTCLRCNHCQYVRPDGTENYIGDRRCD